MSSRSNSRKARSSGAKRTDSARSTRRKRQAESTGGNLLLRDLDPEILDVLRERARRNGRSLQQELHAALRRDTGRNFDEARGLTQFWHERLKDRDLPDSTEMIREDRQR